MGFFSNIGKFVQKKTSPALISLFGTDGRKKKSQASVNKPQESIAQLRQRIGYKPPSNQRAEPSVNPTPNSDVLGAQTQAPMQRPENPFLESLRQISEQRASAARGQAEEQERLISKAYDSQVSNLQNTIPSLQKQFEGYRNSVQGQITDEAAKTSRQQEQAEDLYGEALRASAEANRQSQNQLQNTFAALGTLDSNAFQKMAINQQNKFSRGQQGILKEKAAKAEEINAALNDYRRRATLQIQQEEANLSRDIAEIQNNITLTQLEKDQAINDVYSQAFNTISEIDGQLTALEYEDYNAQQDLAATSLSPEFMATGQPQNANDYEFFIKNQDEVNKYLGQESQSDGKSQVVAVIDQLLGQDVAPITGLSQIRSYIPGTQAQVPKALYNQLQGLLSLENREKLKGSGAISDFEARVLQDAASALSRSLSEEDFRSVLSQLRSQLSGNNTPSLDQIFGY